MSYYLITHPNPYTQQYRTNRRGRLSGGVLLHTTESPKERGALPICNWIATQRRDYGSYHVVVDHTTVVPMAPDSYETWHCAAPGFNQSTFGLSFACRSTDLHPDDPWTQAAFRLAGQQIAGFWVRNGINVEAANRFLPASRLLTEPGLANHGDAQPWDRSDAFARHPQRAGLEQLLRTAINAAHKPIPVPPGEDPEMAKPVLMTIRKNADSNNPSQGTWVFYEGSPWRVRVSTPDDYRTFRFLGVPGRNVDEQFGAFLLRNTSEVKSG